MLITNLKIKNFRNYIEENIDFNKNINIFYGDNAQGKTNIIEAIYISAIGKSFRTNKENELIKIKENCSNIEVCFEKNDRSGKVKIVLENKKNIWLNGIKVKKLSELLGALNIVTFVPRDINILKEGPDERRRFLDIMIGQLKPVYIYNLNMYFKVLEQRNNYLKQIKNEGKKEDLLEIWDEKLADYAEIIFKYRHYYIEKIKLILQDIHNKITNNEIIKINYLSSCNEKNKYINQLKETRKIDILRGYTSKGIHRDDFIIYLNDKEVKTFGSQGQNRTAVLSLKIAELKIIKEEIGEYPILLLDDFMSELDKKRIENFLKSIEDIQVIITCTEKILLNKYDEKEKKINYYRVNDGQIEKTNV